MDPGPHPKRPVLWWTSNAKQFTTSRGSSSVGNMITWQIWGPMFDLQKPCKKARHNGTCLQTQSWRSVDRRSPRARWPASLVYAESSGLVRPCLKKQGGWAMLKVNLWPPHAHAYMCTDTCALTHVHSHMCTDTDTLTHVQLLIIALKYLHSSQESVHSSTVFLSSTPSLP